MRLRLSERSWLALVAFALVLLFWVANRGAYEGFFSDDDFDNLGWTTIVGWDVFRGGFLTPLFFYDNFRPTGHVFYRWMHALAGVDFPRWIAALQLIHLLNMLLVFRLCRVLGVTAQGAVGGAAFFLFHPALFAAFWKPMYIFDVLCATFLLVATLLYLRDRWIFSLAAFWLAYKAKEVAVFYPCALALIELTRGRRWVRLAPFFVISLSFGAQAAIANRGRESDYSLRFSLPALATCAAFYLSQLWPGLVAGGWFGRRDRRVWLALAAFLMLVGPLWFLPGRLFAVYLYVPMLALAVAVAFLLEPVRVAVMAGVLLCWFGFVYLGPLREFRKTELTVARENRLFFESACKPLTGVDPRGVAFYVGGPPHMASHGVEGVLHHCYSPFLKLIRLDPQTANWRSQAPPGTPLLSWNSATRRMRLIDDRDASRMNAFALEIGWYPLTGGLRWSAERAVARVVQPPGASEFYLSLWPTAEQIRSVGKVQIVMLLDGAWIGDASIDSPGLFERGWPVPVKPGEHRIEFQITPGYAAPGDRRRYGLPFSDFGFRRRE